MVPVCCPSAAHVTHGHFTAYGEESIPTVAICAQASPHIFRSTLYPAMQLSVCFIVLDFICCLRDLLHVVAEVAASPLLARNTMRVGDIAMLALQLLCAIKAIADGLRHVTVLATPTLPESALFFCNSRKGCDTQTLPKEQRELSVKGYSDQWPRRPRSSSPSRWTRQLR